MKSRKKLLVLVIAFVVLMAGAGWLYNSLSEKAESNIAESQETGEAEGNDEKSMAPDFVVYDNEGNEVRLSDMRGKPCVLNFWASWCGPCQSEMPDFDSKYRELGDEINFMMVNLTDGQRETVETAEACIADNGYTFPIYFDSHSKAAYAYGVDTIPATYFIDAEGRLVSYANGALSAESLEQGIDMIR